MHFLSIIYYIITIHGLNFTLSCFYIQLLTGLCFHFCKPYEKASVYEVRYINNPCRKPQKPHVTLHPLHYACVHTITLTCVLTHTLPN